MSRLESGSKRRAIGPAWHGRAGSYVRDGRCRDPPGVTRCGLEDVMNFDSGAVASWYGYEKTVPVRRFRPRVGVRRPVSGTPPGGHAPQREHDLREVFNGLRWVVINRLSMALHGSPSMALHAPQPASVGGRLSTDAAVDKSGSVRGDGPRLDLRVLLRLSEGRASAPRATILDSRTLRSTPESGSRVLRL